MDQLVLAFVRSPLAMPVGLLACALPLLSVWYLNRRARRRWELQDQLLEMEQAIAEETHPEEARAWLRRSREHQAEIRREARRRVGLPEEEPRR
jgi:hypothetical protein